MLLAAIFIIKNELFRMTSVSQNIVTSDTSLTSVTGPLFFLDPVEICVYEQVTLIQVVSVMWRVSQFIIQGPH